MSTFEWHGNTLSLLDHPYNGTITNERAVEIPIARAFIAGCEGEGLELGNVLGHYGCRAPRRIVDRYEPGVYVENLDVFEIEGTFDWIVSVSTIEHVRFPENPYGGIAALAYLLGLLRPGGRMLITVGLGQNEELDDFIVEEDEPLGASKTIFLRTRTDDIAVNEWREDWPTPEQRTYGPTHGANAVWIGEWGSA